MTVFDLQFSGANRLQLLSPNASQLQVSRIHTQAGYTPAQDTTRAHALDHV